MERLYNTPMSLQGVADEMHCSVSTVVKYFDDYGISRRKRHVRYRKGLTPEEAEMAELYATMYWMEGHTLGSLARVLGHRRDTVSARFKRWGIPKRPPQESSRRADRTLTPQGRKILSENAKRSWRERTHMVMGPDKNRGTKKAA